MEKRYCALNALHLERHSIDREDDDKYIHVKGYGCHFNTINKNGEMVTAESFRPFFKELEEGRHMPIFNYQHDQQKVIGCWEKITADETGLWCEGIIGRDVQLVKETIEPLMDMGALDSLSTEGWADCELRTDEDGNEYLFCTRFDLCGISLVALPADFDARIESENALQLQRMRKTKTEKQKAKKNQFVFTI